MDHTKTSARDRALKWYALYTSPRAEKQVYSRLVQKNIPVYLPLQSKLQQWSDRKKWVEVPLINSYIFIQSDLADYYDILSTYGVLKFISFNGQPAEIRESDIDLIKASLANYKDIEVAYEGELEKGTQVEIMAGPFRGLNGSLVSYKGKKLIAVQVEQLGFSLVVNLPANIIKPVYERSVA